MWRPDGQLQIVDRLKNLIKLKGGEYIAIESMEKEYLRRHVSGVNGGLMCFGDSDMDRPVAFVVADEKKCCAWADQNGVEHGTFAELCASPEMNKEVLASLVKAGKSGKLGANEILAGILLLPGTGAKDNETPQFEDPWTPENGASRRRTSCSAASSSRPTARPRASSRRSRPRASARFDARAPSPMRARGS